MEHNIQPFIFLPQQRIVICSECRTGCVAKEVEAHLQRHAASRLAVDTRKALALQIRQLPGIIQSQAELQSFVFPAPECAENPFLSPATPDLLGCQHCQYVCRPVQSMQQHYYSQHSWVNPRGRGRIHSSQEKQARLEQVPWRTGVRAQRFFRTREASRWFEVERPAALCHPQGGSSRDGKETAVEESIDARLLRLTQEQSSTFASSQVQTIEAGNEMAEPNPWLRRVGWARHLEGVDLERARSTIAPCTLDEEELVIVKASFERVASEARSATLRAATQIRFDIARKEGHVKPNKPFEAMMEPEAWGRYMAVWWKVLCYLFRTQDWEEGDRPPYRLTTRQERLFEDLEAAVGEAAQEKQVGEDQRQMLDRLCLDLLVSLLDQQWEETEYECVLLSALAVMGIRDDNGWMAAEDYTSNYSAVIKMARMLVVSQAGLEREDKVAAYMKTANIDRRQASERVTKLPEMVRKKVMRFMVMSSVHTSSGPLEWIFDARSYGLKIRFTTVAEGKLDWRGNRVLYQKVSFTMDELRDMLHGLVVEAKSKLQQLLLAEDVLDESWGFPTIDWARLEDDHSEDKVDYSFLSDERNRWSVDGTTYLRDRLLQDEKLKKQWTQAGEPLFRQKTVQQYELWLRDFRQRLLVLMHMTGGLPGRAPEVLGIRYRNTVYGGVRNIFIHDGMVCFVTLYHKNYRSSDQIKVIYRYLPQEVGELLVWYLWLVLPFWQQIQGILQHATNTSPFLWADNIVRKTQQQASRSSRHSSQAEASQEGIAVDIAGIAGPEAEDKDNEDWEEETTVQHGLWTADRMRRAISSHSERLLSCRLNISTWRHISIGIGRKYLGMQVKAEGAEDEGENEEGDDKIRAIQAVHGVQVDGALYARLVQQGAFGTQSQRDRFRRLSIRWHRLFIMGERDGGVQLGKRRAEQWEEAQSEARRARFKRLCNVDIRGQLRQMMGEEAGFRGIQEPVVQAIMRGESPIIQITGTGGGKSLSFMLPAFCSQGGVTIVVVPLVALKGDLLRRCKEAQIDVEVWASGKAARAASMILVTPESAATKGFREFVNRLQVRQQLDRVVVDECHMVLDAVDGFRPQMRQLGRTIAGFGVQSVFLTATLAPRDQAEFYQIMELPPSRARVYRARTTRKNIRYHIRDSGEGKLEEVVQEEVEKALERWPQGKIIVYGGTVARTTRLGEILECPTYHSKIGTTERKTEIMKDWLENGRVITATNALGVGLDIPDIRVVIHAGSPRRLRDYIQESGRAGRDGRASESIVVCRVESRKEREGKNAGKWKDPREAEMIDLIERKTCRRIVIDEIMDGATSRVHCEDDEEACDCCRWERFDWEGYERSKDRTESDSRVSSGEEEEQLIDNEGGVELFERMVRETEWQSQVVKRRIRQEAVETEQFREMYSRWRGVCAACRTEEGLDDEHDADGCGYKGGKGWRGVQAKVGEIRREMFDRKRLGRFAGCYTCGWPQQMCNSWEADRDDGGRIMRKRGVECSEKEMLVEQVATFWTISDINGQDFREFAEKYVGGLGKDEEIWEWMGRRCKIGELEGNNLCRIWFEWIKELETGD